MSYEIPNGNNGGQTNLYKVGQDPSEAIALQTFIVDDRFASTYKIPMTGGEFFNASNAPYDSTHIVINESAARALHLSAVQAVGTAVRFPGNPSEFVISGVVSDFHFGSMKQDILPAWFGNVKRAGTYRYLSFKLRPGSLNIATSVLQKRWSELMADAPFEYTFMDDNLKKIYKTELQLKKASFIATTLVLIIAGLGVFGLISLSIQKRTKEIGIRRILGSPVKSIIALFIKEFVMITLIAGLVACPLAYLIIQQWLSGYAYRVGVTAGPFVLAILSLAFITSLLIGFQTVKATIKNPVRNLRSE